jgi:hypothetical protein
LSKYEAWDVYTIKEHDFVKEGYLPFEDSDSTILEYDNGKREYVPTRKIKDKNKNVVGQLDFFKVASPSFRFMMVDGKPHKILDQYRTEVQLVAEIDEDYFVRGNKDLTLQRDFQQEVLLIFWNSKKRIMLD